MSDAAFKDADEWRARAEKAEHEIAAAILALAESDDDATKLERERDEALGRVDEALELGERLRGLVEKADSTIERIEALVADFRPRIEAERYPHGKVPSGYWEAAEDIVIELEAVLKA